MFKMTNWRDRKEKDNKLASAASDLENIRKMIRFNKSSSPNNGTKKSLLEKFKSLFLLIVFIVVIVYIILMSNNIRHNKEIVEKSFKKVNNELIIIRKDLTTLNSKIEQIKLDSDSHRN